MRLFLGLGAVSICAPLLLGCVTTEQLNTVVGSARAPSASERGAVLAYVRNTWKDPYSIKDAEISDLVSTPVGQAVCVHANSKNSFGAYIGRTYTSFVFKDGAVQRTTQDDPDCVRLARSGLTYRPFPQLERIS